MTDLRRRILFTLGALAVYRLGCHVPLPGIDPEFLVRLFRVADPLNQYDDEQLSTNLLTSYSIFSLGIIPYLTAAVLMRLASAVSPRLRSLEHRSPAGRQKVVRVTRLVAVLIAGIEGYVLSNGLGNLWGVVVEPGPVFQLIATLTMTTGFVAIIWLADQISLRGIGNGVALILFSDIAVHVPGIFSRMLELINTRALNLGLAISLVLVAVAVVAAIVFIERSVRHVWVQYPNQDFGGRPFGGLNASIPLKLNNGGLIPAMIAAWLLNHAYYLVTIALAARGRYEVEDWMWWGWPGSPAHMAVIAALIMAMTYIYTVALLDPGDIAKRLQEKGAHAFGIETERAFRRLLRGLSFFGAVYLAAVYLLPEFLYMADPWLPGPVGGIGFLIATAVAMDTLADLAHRWKQDYREPIAEEFADAIAVATEIPDQPKVRSAGLSEADR